jgi:hypothetical protein
MALSWQNCSWGHLLSRVSWKLWNGEKCRATWGNGKVRMRSAPLCPTQSAKTMYSFKELFPATQSTAARSYKGVLRPSSVTGLYFQQLLLLWMEANLLNCSPFERSLLDVTLLKRKSASLPRLIPSASTLTSSGSPEPPSASGHLLCMSVPVSLLWTSPCSPVARDPHKHMWLRLLCLQSDAPLFFTAVVEA